jgi:hypothetical protein
MLTQHPALDRPVMITTPSLKLKELRAIWAQDLTMLIFQACNTLEDLLGEPERHIVQAIQQRRFKPPLDFYFADWVLNKDSTIVIVPEMRSLAWSEHGDSPYGLVTPRLLAKKLITKRTMEAVNSNQGEIAVVRGSLEQLATLDTA